jgi:hypothetical protein
LLWCWQANFAQLAKAVALIVLDRELNSAHAPVAMVGQGFDIKIPCFFVCTDDSNILLKHIHAAVSSTLQGVIAISGADLSNVNYPLPKTPSTTPTPTPTPTPTATPTPTPNTDSIRAFITIRMESDGKHERSDVPLLTVNASDRPTLQVAANVLSSKMEQALHQAKLSIFSDELQIIADLARELTVLKAIQSMQQSSETDKAKQASITRLMALLPTYVELLLEYSLG